MSSLLFIVVGGGLLEWIDYEDTFGNYRCKLVGKRVRMSMPRSLSPMTKGWFELQYPGAAYDENEGFSGFGNRVHFRLYLPDHSANE